MVGISVEPTPGSVGAAWRPAVVVAQEVKVVYSRTLQLQFAVVGRQEGAAHYYLVEKIPVSTVGEGASSGVENFPPWVVEAVATNVFGPFVGAEGHRARGVVRVVVEVTHYDYSSVWMAAPERVGNLPAQVCRGYAARFAFLFAAEARRPVIDDYAHRIGIAQHACHAKLVAGAQLRLRGDAQGVGGNIQRGEEFGVEQQSHINSALVGRIVMDYAEIVPGKFRRTYQVGHHIAVFHLGYSYHRGARWGVGTGHGRYCRGEIRNLGAVLLSVPFAGSGGCEFEVVAAVGIDGVKEILEIVKCHSIDRGRLRRGDASCPGRLCCGSGGRYENQRYGYKSVHDLEI